MRPCYTEGVFERKYFYTNDLSDDGISSKKSAQDHEQARRFVCNDLVNHEKKITKHLLNSSAGTICRQKFIILWYFAARTGYMLFVRSYLITTNQ